MQIEVAMRYHYISTKLATVIPNIDESIKLFSHFWEKLRAIQKDRDICFLGNQPLSIKHPRIALTHTPPEVYRDSCEALLGEHQLGN